MKQRMFRFFDTENEAQSFCHTLNKRRPKTAKAIYTNWSSDNGEHKFVAWYNE